MTSTPGEGFVPYQMKNVDLIFGDPAVGDNFKCQMRSIVLTPNVEVQRIKTACPTGQFSATDDPEWTLDLGYLYGRHATDQMKALGRFLQAHTGELMDFLVRFTAGQDDDGYTGVVRVIPGPIGGSYGQFSEQSVSLPVEGQPVPLADGGDGSAAAWQAETAYGLADRVSLSGGAVLEADTSGTSGTTEPTAPASVGGTVLDDGTVDWTRVA